MEWLRFLKQIDRETPQDLALHLIADNYCTHKHEKVKAWLEKASPVSYALHTDFKLVDESGGTAFCRYHE